MAFLLTGQDVDWLTSLVRGQSVAEGVPGVRTLSGENNNPAQPFYGAADVPFIRITQAHYGAADQLGNRAVNPIFDGLDPRAISNIIGQQEANLPKAASGANLLFSAFGQYVDHGLDFLAKGGSGTITIGGPGVSRAPGTDNPADLTRGTVVGVDADGNPQHLNKTSNFVDQNQAYGSNTLVGIFLREPDDNGGVTAHLAAGLPDPSSPGFNLLPTLRELIQMHWANDTRFADGTLDTTFRTYYAGLVDENGDINETMLSGLYQDFMGSGQALLIDLNPFISPLDHIVAGDGRVNENITLTAVHTVWARNHNFHVENLLASGFTGSAEELFQAAKIINETEYQRVVFTEFTDVLLGGMRGSGSHGWDGYNPDADPGISHEFAAAAYRFGHSLVTQTVQVVDENGQITDVTLFDAFLNPTNQGEFQFNGNPVTLGQLAQMGYVPQPGYTQLGVGAILGGIVQQQAEEVDAKIVDAIRNDLVRINADLFSFNVARGRDVGLGTLNQVRLDLLNSDSPYIREAVDRWAGNMTPYSSWEDFQARNNLSDELIAQFRQAYPDLVLDTQEEIDAFRAANPDIVLVNGNTVKGIDRVDLWVGGLTEAHINDGMVGQTFWVILHEQFDRLQEADRFYYLDRVDNFPFYAQIDDGAEQGFGAIMARNTGFVWNGENVFLTDRVLADHVAPTVVTFTPGDDAVNVAVGASIVLTFSENVELGSGLIEIRTEGGVLVESFDVANSTRVSLRGAVLTIDPSSDLASGTRYIVTVPPGAVHDEAGNDYAGTVAYDFTTRMSAITGDQRANTLTGTAHGDEMFGLGGNDTLIGHAGNDLLDGGAGADRMTGGTGDDRYVVDNGSDRVTESANGGTDTVVTTLSSYTLGGNVENLAYAGTGNFNGSGNGLDNIIIGNVGSDVLRGAGGNDLLKGEAGNDRLFGDGGNDTLIGGLGSDTLNGGGGRDVFVFDVAITAANRDTIQSFVVADDTIHLSQAVFTGLALGTLSVGAFNTGTAATQADDRIVYNTRTGALIYDEDGLGGTAGVQFATLSNTVGTLSANDFVII